MAGTRWVRLDLDYFTNPKVLAAGRDGRSLHLASLCWCGRHLTDGHIPAPSVHQIVSDSGINRRTRFRAIERVVAAGLWEPDGEGGYMVHDFVEMNGTRADVEKQREGWRQRQRRHRGVDGRYSGDVTP